MSTSLEIILIILSALAIGMSLQGIKEQISWDMAMEEMRFYESHS